MTATCPVEAGGGWKRERSKCGAPVAGAGVSASTPGGIGDSAGTPGRSGSGATLTALTMLLIVCPAFAHGQTTTSADPRLLESIDWYTGVAGLVDEARAYELLMAAAADGDNVLSVMWTARIASRGRMGTTQDEARARRIASVVVAEVRSLAADGDVEAAFLMGTAYDEGLGVDVDFGEALRWYKRAAARGHVLANHNVGNVYRDGRGVDIDHAAAARWWLRAARAGDVIPSLRLGEAFEAGRGVSRDLDSARLWYGKAAAAGNAVAAEALERLGG